MRNFATAEIQKVLAEADPNFLGKPGVSGHCWREGGRVDPGTHLSGPGGLWSRTAVRGPRSGVDGRPCWGGSRGTGLENETWPGGGDSLVPEQCPATLLSVCSSVCPNPLGFLFFLPSLPQLIFILNCF